MSKLLKPPKPKMLVVDDEPDNLDLLYRTFRREFEVFKAENGLKALEVLAEQGEVAVIISDQRMPEMKGTEFLKKTVSNYPHTIRIILTGFTDVADLVDAINSGQVYKYITKPWDPNQLKEVVAVAVENYQIQHQKDLELNRTIAQIKLLISILQIVEKSANLETMLEAIAQALGENLSSDNCILQQVIGGIIIPKKGILAKTTIHPLEDDQLVKLAIATLEVQSWLKNTDSDYNCDLAAHIVFPIYYKKEVLAVLSLQWTNPKSINEAESQLMDLVSKQIAIALISKKP